MSKAAFLVEGLMEQRFIQAICPGAKVVTIGCNGRDASMKTIALFIAKHLRLMNGRFRPVFVWLDREGRIEPVVQLLADLSAEMAAHGFCDCAIGMPDRHTENWILHDWNLVSSKAKGGPSAPHSVEGAFGKAILRKVLPDYTEVITGVELLKAINVSEVYDKSASFAFFVDQISIPCWWLEPIKGGGST